MPNYCDFKMNVRGIPANVDEFIKIIQAPDYTQRHLYRVFEAELRNLSGNKMHTKYRYPQNTLFFGREPSQREY